jgi:hypothetical protein
VGSSLSPSGRGSEIADILVSAFGVFSDDTTGVSDKLFAPRRIIQILGMGNNLDIPV